MEMKTLWKESEIWGTQKKQVEKGKEFNIH